MGEKKRFLDRVLRFMGIEEEVAASEEFEERVSPSPSATSSPRRVEQDLKGRTTTSSPSVRTFTRVRPVALKPLRFNDVQSIADRLTQRTPVLIDVEQLDVATARRVLDFLSGTTYALEGHIQKVTEHTFLLAPGGVEVDMSGLEGDVGTGSDEEFTFRGASLE